MEQYGSLYQHIEKVIKNLSKFKLFYFFTWDWNEALAKNSHLNILPLLCQGKGSPILALHDLPCVT